MASGGQELAYPEYVYPEYSEADERMPSPYLGHAATPVPHAEGAFLEHEYVGPFSEAGDDPSDKLDDSRKHTLTELHQFSDELRDAPECGTIFMLMWCINQLARGKGTKDLGQVFPKQDGTAGKAAPRIFNGMLWMIVIVSAQIILYISLAWAVIQGGINFAQPYNPYTNTPPKSLCPGQDNHTMMYGPTYDKDDWQANMPQNLCFAALMCLMIGMTSLDWMKTHKMFRKFMRSVAPVGYLTKRHLKPSGERLFVQTQRRYKWVIFLDFFTHVVMTIVVYLVTVFAVFYLTTVGKMLAIVFALGFMEKVDDNAKQDVLSTTPLAKWMYLVESRLREHSPQRSQGSGAIYTISMVLYHLSYLAVYAIIIWSLVWTGKGCKPGKKNALDYF